MTTNSQPTIRRELRAGDEATVQTMVAASGFFTPEEVDIAVELVEERRNKGDASGYHFLFLQDGKRTIGYVCHGPIAGTESSYDLYWIAISNELRGSGLGKHLLAAAERDIAAAGGQRIYVDTSSRAASLPPRAFYERAGYHVAAELPDFYAPQDGKVIFCKLLVGTDPA